MMSGVLLMMKIIDNGGLVDIILRALGLSSEISIVDEYSFFYNLFAVSLALIFVILFVVILFRCLSSLFKSART